MHAAFGAGNGACHFEGGPVERELLEACAARVRRFHESRDLSAVLGSDAEAAAAGLWDMASGGAGGLLAAPVEVLAALGYLFFFRFQVLPEGEDEEDRRKADLLFSVLMSRAPERVPAQVRPALGTPDPDLLCVIGTSLFARFEQTRDPADLDAAADVGAQAVTAAPPGHPLHGVCASNLGIFLRIRFEVAGDLADLEAAVSAGASAVNSIGQGEPDAAGWLFNFATVLMARFRQGGDQQDLDAAIDLARRASAVASPDGPDRPLSLGGLGAWLLARFKLTRDTADLDGAVTALGEVADSQPGHPDRSERLSDLGAGLLARFEWAGDDADLDAAVRVLSQAVAAVPAGSPPSASGLSNLGNARRIRFERSGDAADLDLAIEAGEQAVGIAPAGDPQRPAYLANLGASLGMRFRKHGALADLDHAIEAGRQAVAGTADGDEDLPIYLSNLGNSLRARFELTRQPKDLDDAIAAGRRAVRQIPAGHSDRASHLSSLGASLATRFKQTGDLADLDAGLDVQQQAAQAIPPEHPDRAVMLSDLGVSLRSRFERTGNPADLDGALGCWQQAARVNSGTPAIRLAAARHWGAAAAAAGRTRDAADGYAAAVELLAVTAWHGLDQGTREDQLAQWAGLAADAAACAIIDGRAEHAVELLEQGRAVLWAQALNLRTDLSRLAAKAPSLARRLDSIRKVLDASLSDAERRRQLARQWDETVARARQLGGEFAHFLDTVPYQELAAAASGGAVVIVNVSVHGCHALIVRSGHRNPEVVDLEDLTIQAAVEQANRLLSVTANPGGTGDLARHHRGSRQSVLQILSWIWDTIAEPVLTALGHTSPPGSQDPWPRVWWCPIGPATILPIHAAGHYPADGAHDRRAARSAPERVISSYTPTLTALARARLEPAPAPSPQLTVALPSAPHAPPLPAAASELAVLTRYFPPGHANRQLTGADATRSSVLNAMASSSWVHLACHARQQHDDPSRSSFAVWDGDLTIADLARQPSANRGLAFLSACETATGTVRQLDEALHLAAAMQFLGYRHVIATMWTIADSPAPRIADRVYSMLAGSHAPRPEQAAEALHLATKALRESAASDPLLWAPYVHYGG